MKTMRCFLFAMILLPLALHGQTRKLDTTSLVVMGEGLAAGLHDFTLSSNSQEKSFPAQVAKRLGTPLVQPLLQPPGIGNVPGFLELPVIVTRALQTTVRTSPPSLFVQNLSVPGMRLSDAASRRPLSPLLHRNDAFQTSLNMLLGFPALLLEVDGEKVPLWSQLEYARKLFPTLAIVELGYVEAIDAAVRQDVKLIPDTATFRSNYGNIVSALRKQHAEVIVLTIPDPTDTAYFMTTLEAARQLRAEPFFLMGLYDLQADDLITIPGLNEIAFQFFGRRIEPLPNGVVLKPASAAAVRNAVKALNAEISSIAQTQGAVVCDLAALLAGVRARGVTVGGRALTAGYLEGFYTMNGFYPGITGQAVIANEVLATINRAYGTSYAPVDTAAVLAEDQTAQYARLQSGPEIGLEDLRHILSDEAVVRIERRMKDAATQSGDSQPAEAARPRSRSGER